MNRKRKAFLPMSRLLVFAGLLSFFGFTFPLEPALGQSNRPAALEPLVDGAKKEGIVRLQWLAGEIDGEVGLRPIVAAMNKKYGTNVKLQFTPGPDFATMLNKIAQEKAAGATSSTDVNLMTSNHVAQGLKIGLFRKFDWDTILDRRASADAIVNRIAPEGIAAMIGSAVVGITYNTNLVKGDDVPVSMEDVFKPKWKGKIASTPYATGLYHFAARDILGYDSMKKYTQRLARQIGGLFGCTNVERIASGEFAMMVFDCGSYNTLRYQKRGAPVTSTPSKEATRVNHFYMGVPAHAEHPNAGALLIAFLNTLEGQNLLWDITRLDLHIYPESRSRKEISPVVKAGGKVLLDTVEHDLKSGHEELNRIRDEFVKILKEGGR